jgi:hypothetical protein
MTHSFAAPIPTDETLNRATALVEQWIAATGATFDRSQGHDAGWHHNGAILSDDPVAKPIQDFCAETPGTIGGRAIYRAFEAAEHAALATA